MGTLLRQTARVTGAFIVLVAWSMVDPYHGMPCSPYQSLACDFGFYLGVSVAGLSFVAFNLPVPLVRRIGAAFVASSFFTFVLVIASERWLNLPALTITPRWLRVDGESAYNAMLADVFLTYFGVIFVVTVALALRHNAPNKRLEPTGLSGALAGVRRCAGGSSARR